MFNIRSKQFADWAPHQSSSHPLHLTASSVSIKRGEINNKTRTSFWHPLRRSTKNICPSLQTVSLSLSFHLCISPCLGCFHSDIALLKFLLISAIRSHAAHVATGPLLFSPLLSILHPRPTAKVTERSWRGWHTTGQQRRHGDYRLHCMDGQMSAVCSESAWLPICSQPTHSLLKIAAGAPQLTPVYMGLWVNFWMGWD